MKKIILATTMLGIVAFAPGAMAADPVVESVYDWTGIYLGGAVGYGWSNDDWTYVGDIGLDLNDSDSSVAFGGAIGYQGQFDSFVLGLEGGVIANIGGAEGACPNVAFDCIIDDATVFYIGPKIGLAMDNWLFSLVGGYAGGDVDTETPLVATGVAFDSSSEWHNGWFIGAGVDYGITENFIVGVNYKHVDLGSQSHSPSPFNATEVRDIDVKSDMVSATFTLLFNP